MSSTPGQAAAPLPEKLKTPGTHVVKRFVQGDLASLRVFVVLGLIWAIFQIENSHFLTAQNLTNLFLQITAVGLISVGVVYVLLLGEIDLSVGAVSGLAAAATAVLQVKHGWSPYTAIAAGVVVGMTIGAVQGFLFTQFGIPSFVVTLAGLLIWQGALLKVLGSTGTVNITDPKITGLANTFYSSTVSWIIGIVVIAVYAGGTLLAWRHR
ncbi:MAG: D-xylose transport system permease protein, partial [Solirubrobacteraceae bacterium]|nr:D-xylose transport system permease protein [Solirubrobacteraceae bacterium]